MKPTIAERFQRAVVAEYISLDDGVLLFNVSKSTLRRRLPQLEDTHDVLRHRRIVRVRREALLRLFGRR